MRTFELPRLYPIIDTASLRLRNVSPLVMAEALLEAGARILQFRHKDPWTEADYQQAKQIALLAQAANVLFILNDRADYAVLLESGVHVGQDDLPPAAVHQVVGKAVIGFSTHNREQLVGAEAEAVDYLALGPIYQTNSKRDPDPALGVEGLRVLRPLTQKSLVAIGGISLSNAGEVLAAGADSVAVIGALLPEGCSRESIRALAGEWLRLVR